MGIRSVKAARLKLQILEHTVKLIGKKSFEDLHVDHVCDKVKVSKVTFFKYFPQKEDILLYYHRIWCFERAVELEVKKKEGLAGVTYLFDRMSDEYENYPGLLLSLVGYLSSLKRKLKPMGVKLEEKQLLYPDHPEIKTVEILSIDQVIEKFVLEAIFNKEIVRSSATRDISNVLLTVLYGSIIVAHTKQQSPVKLFFRKNLDMVLKSVT
jgi:AcrR family transcriptional regulator